MTPTEEIMNLRLGMDIGGTNIKVGVLDERFQSVTFHIRPVRETDRSESGMMERLVEMIGEVEREVSPRYGILTSVGIGIAGIINLREGIITKSPNFPLWNNMALGVGLRSRIKLPVFIDNDANAATAGEALCGSGRGSDHFICYTLGTGVGGGIYLNHHVWRGVDGMAGELGHMTVEPEGRPCNCGNRGCLEQYASLQGLKRFVAEHAPADLQPDDRDLPKIMAERAAKGDMLCRQAFESFGRYLGIAAAGMLNALNVKKVVLSGGLSNTMPLFLAAMRKEIHSRSFPAVSQGVEILKGGLGDKAGVYGAAVLDVS